MKCNGIEKERNIVKFKLELLVLAVSRYLRRSLGHPVSESGKEIVMLHVFSVNRWAGVLIDEVLVDAKQRLYPVRAPFRFFKHRPSLNSHDAVLESFGQAPVVDHVDCTLDVVDSAKVLRWL